MLSKQFVYGCSKAVFSILLLVSSTYSFSMEEESLEGDGPARSSYVAVDQAACLRHVREQTAHASVTQDESSDGDGIEVQRYRPRVLQSDRSFNYFENYTQAQLDEAYDQASPRIKTVLQRLRHPEIRPADPDIRAAFFDGEPGSGKTRAAVMLAYKLGWAYITKRATRFTESSRGGATVNLRQMLDSMVAPEPDGTVVPTVGIIDEVQEILAHAGDSHYDAESTSLELGGFLEDHRNNGNFFLIATMNGCKTFLKSMKSRMKGKFFTFTDIIDPYERVRAFLNKIRTDKITVEGCSEQFLLGTVGRMEACYGRDLRSLAGVVVDKAFETADVHGNIEIRPEHIRAAVQQMEDDDRDLSYEEEEETDREMRKNEFQQRERHHRQSIRANLLSQTRQRTQTTDSSNAGAGLGAAGFGVNVGTSVSRTSAPGMSRADAERTLRDTFGDSEEIGDASITRSELLDRIKELEELCAHQDPSALFESKDPHAWRGMMGMLKKWLELVELCERLYPSTLSGEKADEVRELLKLYEQIDESLCEIEQWNPLHLKATMLFSDVRRGCTIQ